MRLDVLAALGGLAYLGVLGYAMQHTTFDTWGALVVGPVLVVISVPLIRRAFAGEHAWLRRYAWLGLAAKFAGAIVGYNVRVGIYGSGDALRYHGVGVDIAAQIWRGEVTLAGLVPTSTGTAFTEELAGRIFALSGTSLVAGFLVFAWVSYWGLVLALKAAIVVFPGLATRRYALLLFLFPSLVYWGSSIGKEAIVGFTLGLATYGAALVLGTDDRRRVGALLVLAGLAATARVRPHFAAIWAGALVIALVVRSIRDVRRRRSGASRFATLAMVAVAAVGFVAIATFTLDFLSPPTADESSLDPVGDRIELVFDNAAERTTTGGSQFTPVATGNPAQWPYAAYRTLTRPLVTEADSLGELLPGIEMTALVALMIVSWRRLLWGLRSLPSQPYLVFVVICLLTFGVAFASIGNLGILVRQRSLILPLLLLLPCLPAFGREPPDAAERGRTDARALAAG